MSEMNVDLPKGIDDLPEEILSKVFQYLRHGDLMNSTLVCKKWNEVIGQNMKIMEKINLVFTFYGAMSMPKNLTRTYQSICIQDHNFEEYVNSRHIIALWDEVFNTMDQCAKNLRDLTINCCDLELIGGKKFNKMFASLTNLQSLKISYLKFSDGRTKIDLSPLVRLKSLSLSYGYDAYDSGIWKLPGSTQLISLVVDCLKYYAPSEFQIMFEPNYKYSECLINFLARQKSLEVLAILNSNITLRHNLQQLKAIEFPLKRLALYEYDNMLDNMSYQSDENLLQFMSMFVNSLEELYIHRKFSESFYEMIFTKFRKLHTLSVFVNEAPTDEAFYRRVQPNTSIQKLIVEGGLCNKPQTKPVQRFIGILPNIQTLDLQNTDLSKELMTSISYNLNKLVNLKVNVISHQAFVRVTIPNLKSLSVNELLHDKPVNWKEIVRATPNIEVFMFGGYHFHYLLNDENIKIMAKGWPKLRHFKFGCGFAASKEIIDLFLFYFKNLKVVECFEYAFTSIPEKKEFLLDTERNGLSFIIHPRRKDTSFRLRNCFHEDWEKSFFCANTRKQISRKMKEENDESLEGINNLPDVVLSKVFQSMDFETLMSSTLVCKKWNEVIGHSKAIMKRIKIVIKLRKETPSDLTRIYSTILIHGFGWFHNWTSIMKTIGPCVNDLQDLHIANCKIKHKDMEIVNKLLATATNLEKLGMTNVECSKTMNQYQLHQHEITLSVDLSHLKLLNSLELTRVECGIEKFAETAQLTSLKINGIYNKSSEFLIDFLAKQNSLKEFSIDNCGSKIRIDLKKLQEIQFALKKLEFNWLYSQGLFDTEENLLLFLDKFTNSLEDLNIRRTDSITKMIFNKFHKLNTLELCLDEKEPKTTEFYQNLHPNLSVRKLTIHGDDILMPMKGYLGKLPNIETLYLQTVKLSNDLLMLISNNLAKLKKLQVKMVSADVFQGVIIPSLKSITILNFDCKEPQSFKPLIEAMPNLEELNVRTFCLRTISREWGDANTRTQVLIKFGYNFQGFKEIIHHFLSKCKHLKTIEISETAFQSVSDKEAFLLDFKRDGLSFIIHPNRGIYPLKKCFTQQWYDDLDDDYDINNSNDSPIMQTFSYFD